MDTDSEASQASASAPKLIAYYFDLLNLIFVSIVAVYMTYFCLHTENEALLNWHVWLCTIGYQVLMAEAILAFYEMNALTLSVSRQRRKTIHWIVQTIGFIVTFIGVMLEFIRREKYGSTHFTTAHSITGLIAGIFSLISLINGVVASKAYRLRYSIKPIYSKILHNLTGILCFVIGMVSLYYGYDASNMVRFSHPDIRLGLQVLAILTILLSLVGALRSLNNQIRTIFNLSFDES